MTKLNLQFSHLTTGLCFVLLMSIAVSYPLKAQPIVGAENIALGGGGTAYLSGFEATFWNPANLAVNERQGTIHFGIAHTGILYEPVLSSNAPDKQFLNFTDTFYPYKSDAVGITPDQRQSILNHNYPRNSLTSQHQSRADIILGGLSWQRGEATFTFAARARFSSRTEVGRGWYSEDFVTSNEQEVRDFTLNQQINQFLEFSLGYGREFTFIQGLLPRLSKLYVGIAPKFVLAGPSFNATYDARYIQSEDGNSDIYTTDFFYRTTGDYSQMTFDYLSASSDPETVINRNLSKALEFQTTGYGMGFDFGLTYLIPLGNDLNIIEDTPEKSVVAKSLRFAISINDLGMIRYSKEPLELSSQQDTTQTGSESPKESMFIGSGGQYLVYFDEADSLSNPIRGANNTKEGAFSALMPTSLNAGVMIDFNRIKIMGDLSLGLNNTAFTNTKLAIHLGLEARPLQQVPIRLGARIASGFPTRVSLGTGIETRYWDFNIGSQLLVRSNTFTSEITGGAFAGIQLHL